MFKKLAIAKADSKTARESKVEAAPPLPKPSANFDSISSSKTNSSDSLKQDPPTSSIAKLSLSDLYFFRLMLV
jgi:hypothetical protein